MTKNLLIILFLFNIGSIVYGSDSSQTSQSKQTSNNLEECGKILNPRSETKEVVEKDSHPMNRECKNEGCKRLARHAKSDIRLMCRKCYHEHKRSDTFNSAQQCKNCGRYYYWDEDYCSCKK